MFSRQQKYLANILLVVGIFSWFLITPTISKAYDETLGDTRPLIITGSGSVGTGVLGTGGNGTINLTGGNGGVNVNSGGADAGQANNPINEPAKAPLDLGSPVYNMLFGFVVTFFGWLLSWGSWLLEIGITQFMLGFGDKYFNQNIGVAVEETWKIIRDLFNLTFIFGLVYIGFKMILDSDDSNARKGLVNLIGAALFVNFSLFIVKFVIDLSHITASVIANGLTAGGAGIGNAFINVIGLGSIFDVTTAQINHFQTDGGALAYIFGTMIFLAVAAFVFAAGGILLIIRFIVLNIYLVFSPIMFLGWVFPSMSSYSSKYWDGFLRQAFFAPAYLMMLYLSLKVLESYKFKIGSVRYGDVFAGGAGFSQSGMGSAAEIIPFFILAMAFMILSLVVAKNMGAVGAGTAISFGNKITGKITGGLKNAGLGASGLAYRNTGGRLSKGALNLMDSSGLSNMPGTRSLRSAIKSGYEYGAGGTSLAKTRSDIKAEKADITDNRSRMFKETKKKERDAKIKAGMSPDATQDQIEALEQVGANASSSDLEGMTHAQRMAIAPFLSTSTLDDVGKSEKIEAKHIKEIKDKYKETLKGTLKVGGEIMTEKLTELSKKQIEILGDDFITEYSADFSSEQFKEILKSEKLTESQKNRFRSSRKAITDTRMSSSTPDDVAKVFQNSKKIDVGGSVMVERKNKKAKEIATLPGNVLTNDKSISYISLDVIKEIVSQRTLTEDERSLLIEKVTDKKYKNKDRNKIIGYLKTSKGIEEFGDIGTIT